MFFFSSFFLFLEWLLWVFLTLFQNFKANYWIKARYRIWYSVFLNKFRALLLLINVCLIGISFNQLLLSSVDNIIYKPLSTLCQLSLFTTSHFVQQMAISYNTLFVSNIKFELCLQNNELLYLYLSYKFISNIQIKLNQ